MKKRNYEKGKNYISVSQYSAAKGCNMKWYLKNVAYVKYAQSAGKELGVNWHSLIEDFIAGKDVDNHFIKTPLFKTIFEKNPWFPEFLMQLKAVLVEHSIDYTLPGGSIFIGDVDIIARNTKVIIDKNGKVIEVKYLQGHTTIIDWKTMSSWNYALDSEKLSRDDQVLIYGNTEKETKEVIHVQINHREREIKFVVAPFKKDLAILVEANINAMSIEMQAMRKQDIKFIKKNRNHCPSFGGCPNLPYCNGKETLEQLKERVKPKEALSNEAEVTERLQGLSKELGKDNIIKTKPIEEGKKMGFKEMLEERKRKAAEESMKQTSLNFSTPPAPPAQVVSASPLQATPVPPAVITTAVVGVVETPTPDPREETKKHRKPRTVKVDAVPEPDLSGAGGQATPQTVIEAAQTKVTPKIMATMVLINCVPNGQEYTQPTEFLKEDIQSILKANNIQCLAESKFNEAAKMLFKIQDKIKDALAAKVFVYIDTKRIADNTVLEMLYGDDRFIIIGGKF